MFLWCFAKAGQMVDHRFTDDVAIVFAVTKDGAIRKFQNLYIDAETFREWSHDCYLETFIKHYTTESGDKIVAFGKWGYE